MGNQRKRRTARRRLKAHERGDDRHVKSAAYRGKRNRLALAQSPPQAQSGTG